MMPLLGVSFTIVILMILEVSFIIVILMTLEVIYDRNIFIIQATRAGSVKANERDSKSCLGRVFYFKLGHFATLHSK
jgi:hypothetical protein